MKKTSTSLSKVLLKHLLFIGVPCVNAMAIPILVGPGNMSLTLTLLFTNIAIFTAVNAGLEITGWQFK